MRKIILPMLAVAGALVLGGCSLYGGSQNSAPSNSAGSTAVSPSTSNAISIQNFAFNPSATTVKKGTTVTWTNNDSAPHQIKSATFNSGQLGKGQSFTATFNDAGTFDYSCAIHPSMTGKIIVE